MVMPPSTTPGSSLTQRRGRGLSWVALVLGILLSPSAAVSQDTSLTGISSLDVCTDAYPLCPRPELYRLAVSLGLNNDRPNLTHDCPHTFAELPPGAVLTSTTLCAAGLTPPSLWWIQEQFANQGKGYRGYRQLVTNWLTYLPTETTTSRVDLVVDLQIWSTMDYFRRYEFLNTFGESAQTFGYNLRTFSFRGEFLGAYTCDRPIPEENQARCTIQMDRQGAQARPQGGLTGF